MNVIIKPEQIKALWRPASEKPRCIATLLCWKGDGTYFVHDHYSHDDEKWNLFVQLNHVIRYLNIAHLLPYDSETEEYLQKMSNR